MGLDWKFRGAIKIGDTIKVRAEIAEKKPMPRLGGGLVTFNVEVINQREETCQKGTWTMLVKAKGMHRRDLGGRSKTSEVSRISPRDRRFTTVRTRFVPYRYGSIR